MYSQSFRKAAICVYLYLGSMRKTSVALHIGAASISRWCRNIERKKRVAQSSKVTDALIACVVMLLESQPATTCPMIVAHIHNVLGIKISRQLAHVVVKKSGHSWKRTRKRGVSSRTSQVMIPFLDAFRSTLKTGSIVAVDESGFDARCSPVYGYAPRGRPAIVKWKPISNRKRYSLLMAVHADGRSSRQLHSKTVNSTTFSEFICQLPFPRGTTLLLDNASIHRTHLVRSAATNMGYTLLYTPPYCPEFNPIELVFGVIKSDFYRLRYTDAFTNDLEQAVKDCVERNASPATIVNCFHHVEKELARSETCVLT